MLFSRIGTPLRLSRAAPQQYRNSSGLAASAAKYQKLLDTNNSALGFDFDTLQQKAIADQNFEREEHDLILSLQRSPDFTPEKLALMKQEFELKKMRRAFYFQNRAAIVQRAKFKQEKERVAAMAKEIEDRFPSSFGIQDVIRLLNTHPDNNMAVYDVATVSTFNDYMVVVTAASVRHMRHMADAFYKIARAATKHQPKTRQDVMAIDGLDCDDWVLVDLGDIMVHFFLKVSSETFLCLCRTHCSSSSAVVNQLLAVGFTGFYLVVRKHASFTTSKRFVALCCGFSWLHWFIL